MKNVESYFNSRSSVYENAIRQNFIWENIKAKEEIITLKLLCPQKDEYILDAGSGPGIYAEILKNKGCRVVCIDVASSMIHLVKQKGIEGHILDIENFFFEQKFDKIICLGALEFISSPEKALYNLAGHLKKNGYIVLCIPMRGVLGYNYKMFYYFHGIHIRIFSLDEIKSLLRKAGLEIERLVRIFSFSCIMKVRPIAKG